MKQDKIIIYKPRGGGKGIDLKVKLEQETVWLSLDQMAMLFGRDKSVISRHIKNVFRERELAKKSVVANFATTAKDKKVYNVDYYNLDVIISVGYRVKSQDGVRFRQWATKILKQYLLQGYAVNEERILKIKENFNDLRNVINFLHEKSQTKLLKNQTQELLNLLSSYNKTLSVLAEYDKGRIIKSKGHKSRFVLDYKDCLQVIKKIRKELIVKKEASDLFGAERGNALKSIVGNLYQTFSKKELYPTLEDKAVHLLYLIIKDHPFSDGNKRIAAFLFIYFLDKNGHLHKKSGEKKINDNALVALALLIAQSDPKEKDILIKLVIKLIVE